MLKLKRSLSIICAILMLLSIFSIPVSVSAKGLIGGTSGSIKWTVNSKTKTLKINAKDNNHVGKISDYEKSAPWDKYKQSIKYIVVGNNITSIGKYPFKSLDNVVSIDIGNKVDSISALAFHNSSSLSKITVSDKNKTYCSQNGILFNKEKTKLNSYPVNKSGSKYVISPNITEIGPYAFSRVKNLKSIQQESASVIKIGDAAFANSDSLKTVRIKNNCTSLGEKTFYSSNKLTGVSIPPSVTNIKNNGKDLFSPSKSMSKLIVTLAKNSVVYNKLKDKGYKLNTKDYGFTCHFDAVDGEIDKTKRKVVFGKKYGKLPVPEKEGYSFVGWYLGENKITKDTIVNTAKAHTLTAKYIGKKYTIELEPNGGICDYQTITVVFDSPYGELPLVAKNGFEFLGWFNSDGERIYADNIFNDTELDTLYAHWKRVLDVVNGLTIKCKNKNKIKLSWHAQDNVSGYKIYRKINNGKWKSYKTVTRNSWISPKLSNKKKYSYYVKSFYNNDDGTISYGEKSSSVSRIATYVPKVKIATKYKTDSFGTKVKVLWTCSGAKKFVVQKKVNGKWKKILRSSSKSLWFYANSNVKYSYRIKGYKTVLKHNFYGKWNYKNIKI